MGRVLNFAEAYDGTLFEDARGVPYTRENPPPWAVVQYEVGIRRIMSTWQAERWIDPDTGSVRYGLGELCRHPAMPQEAEALARIETQARAWYRAAGRTYITETEAYVLKYERKYMQECQTPMFRRAYPKFAPPDYRITPQDGEDKTNAIDESLCHKWIEFRTQIPRYLVKDLLANVTCVYELRAALDMDGEAPVQSATERAEANAA